VVLKTTITVFNIRPVSYVAVNIRPVSYVAASTEFGLPNSLVRGVAPNTPDE
jgi:hypothetical protein